MKLKEYLKMKCLTEYDFADILGITQPHVSYIVNGKKNPSAGLAKKIEDVTNSQVTFNDLYSSKAPSRLKKNNRKIKEKK